MPLIDVILQIVEHTWDLSAAVLPYLFLAAAVLSLAAVASGRRTDDLLDLLVASQRGIVTAYGTYLVAGLVVGGAINAFFTVERLVPGAVVATGFLLYAYTAVKEPEPVFELDTWKHHLIYGCWLVVPVVAVAGLVSMSLLLQSVVALAFYSTLFWRI